MDFEEKVTGTKHIFDGNIIKLRVDDVLMPDGSKATREVIAHNGGVGVIALTDENEVPMVSQYRIAAKSMMLEIPAGKLEYGEDPLECGKRELIEETGYEGTEFEYLGGYYATPGYCEEKLHIYLARGLKWVGQNLDDGEFLNVERYSIDELYNMVMNNEIHDCKTAIAILKTKEILLREQTKKGE